MKALQFLRELLSLIQTDGGHVLLALVLLFAGLLCFAHWHIAEGKDLFAFAMGLLGYSLKNDSK